MGIAVVVVVITASLSALEAFRADDVRDGVGDGEATLAPAAERGVVTPISVPANGLSAAFGLPSVCNSASLILVSKSRTLTGSSSIVTGSRGGGMMTPRDAARAYDPYSRGSQDLLNDREGPKPSQCGAANMSRIPIGLRWNGGYVFCVLCVLICS